MLRDEEIEALVLGLRLVAQRTDAQFPRAAMDALAKIAAVLPDDLREGIATIGLLAGPDDETEPVDLAAVRAAIRGEQKLVLHYVDRDGEETQRVIWPIAIGFFKRAQVIAAWCELRQDFRHFRTDRIVGVATTGKRYPRRRHVLMKEWREIEGVAEQI